MLLEERMEGEALVVKFLESRLDAHIAGSFKDKIGEYIDGGKRQIVLNFAATEFIDSSGLGAIVSSLKRIGQNGDLAICELQDATMSMFKLTRMDKVFSIYPSEQDALSGMS